MLVVVMVWLDGVVIYGADESTNVCVNKIQKLASPLFPSASYAVHVTVEFPIGNILPDAGEQLGPLVTPTLSVAVPFENVTTAPCGFVVSKLMLSGGVTTGSVVSSSL